jgi:3'(2'), 5'-bisphosphate nucleotidase
MEDVELAAKLAEEAGAILMQLRKSGISGKALGEIGDAQAHRSIADALARHRPDDGFVSEECSDSLARLSKRRVWIVDPLDGTREYSEGRDDWAVQVALAIGGRPEVGALALPQRGLMFTSEPRRKTKRRRIPDKLRIVVSRTRPPPEAEKVVERLGAELILMGSCGAKAVAVLMGEADIYLHSGGQFEWDSCAPVAVAQAAGFHCSRLDGSPLIYNQKALYLPDLLICRSELAQNALKTLRS